MIRHKHKSSVLHRFLIGTIWLAISCGDDTTGAFPENNELEDTQTNSSDDETMNVELNGKYIPNGEVEPPMLQPGFLHVEGNQLLDDHGKSVRLTGVNWFGFETGNLSPHGLWTRDYRSMMKQIADMGFNSVRIPWCNAMLDADAKTSSINTDGIDPYDNTSPMNTELEGKTPLEVLDLIIDAAGESRLKVILDNHSRAPDGYMEEKLWYTDKISETDWVNAWRMLAERYYGNTTVVALDLNNEPHGNATWGADIEGTDWNFAAERCGNAIQQINPDVLIIVEGVEKVDDDSYWWGGNLQGVRNVPIQLRIPQKLVYSAHEYGPEVFAQPWFSSSTFPNNLPDIWNRHFGYVSEEKKGHLFIGEFGIRDRDFADGTSGIWFDTFLGFMETTYSWTFWCMNPNSGDTQGILQDDWVTPHQWKLDALAPHLADMID